MNQSEREVLEEEEAQELAHSDVGPSAVYQQEALQVTELSEGVVAGHDGLHALLSTDPHTNVCSWRRTQNGSEPPSTRSCRAGVASSSELTLDHVDVIGSVSDGQRHGLLVLLHQTHHISFLFGGHATANDRLTLTGHVHKVDLQGEMSHNPSTRCQLKHQQ